MAFLHATGASLDLITCVRMGDLEGSRMHHVQKDWIVGFLTRLVESDRKSINAN